LFLLADASQVKSRVAYLRKTGELGHKWTAEEDASLLQLEETITNHKEFLDASKLSFGCTGLEVSSGSGI